MSNLNAFKAYDVRGRIPDEINEELAYDIGRAYAAFVQPQRVAVGYDIRLSSPALASALSEKPAAEWQHWAETRDLPLRALRRIS